MLEDNHIGVGMDMILVWNGVLALFRGVLMNVATLKQELYQNLQDVKAKVLTGLKLVDFGKKKDLLQNQGSPSALSLFRFK